MFCFWAKPKGENSQQRKQELGTTRTENKQVESWDFVAQDIEMMLGFNQQRFGTTPTIWLKV